METLTDTLVQRVDELIHAPNAGHEWGSPHLSATPPSVALGQLAAEVAALGEAVREIAREVERLSAEH